MPFVFVDIDTQFDFMMPDGALYVPGAENLVPNFEQLYALAKTHGIPVVATMDSHVPNDPEFAEYNFPAHCVKGTEGWKKIPETVLSEQAVVTRGGEEAIAILPQQVVIEKVAFSVFTNPRAEEVICRLVPRLAGFDAAKTEYIVFGVATDYCVKAAAIGLAERGAKVCVVTDAIAAVAAQTGQQAIEEMAAAGVKFIRTGEVATLFAGGEIAETRGC